MELNFGIRCEERRGEKLNTAAQRKDDGALWYGDAVELLIETESHSYYQIAISPNGQIADLDRSTTHDKWFSWDSNAVVATHVEDVTPEAPSSILDPSGTAATPPDEPSMQQVFPPAPAQ